MYVSWIKKNLLIFLWSHTHTHTHTFTTHCFLGGTTSLSSRNSLFVALCGYTCFSYTASLNIPLTRAATILCLFSFLTGDTYLIHTYIAYITILTPPQPTPIRNIIGINIGVSIKLIKEHYSSVGSTWFIRAPQQSPLPVHREMRSSI